MSFDTNPFRYDLIDIHNIAMQALTLFARLAGILSIPMFATGIVYYVVPRHFIDSPNFDATFLALCSMFLVTFYAFVSMHILGSCIELVIMRRERRAQAGRVRVGRGRDRIAQEDFAIEGLGY